MSKRVIISDSFDELSTLLNREKRVVVLIDKAISHLYKGVFSYPFVEIPISESTKTLSTVEHVARSLTEMECGRDAFLLCVGGGILTDIGGFTASIYKRGIRCGYVPTTLLAQVDASVGGKTGVNLDGLKNILGTFSLPEFSYINVSALKTLSHRELLSGAAELIKIFIIKELSSFKAASELFRNGVNVESEGFLDLLKRGVELKQSVVESDFRENGERKILNFGHTFGHAIEKCALEEGRSLPHGEAVVKGMVIAAKISHRVGLLAYDELNMILDTFTAMGYDLSIQYPIDKMVHFIKNDKKKVERGVDFVLLQQIGVSCVKNIQLEELKELTRDVLY